MEFQEITNVDELIDFLENRGKRHNYYYHYTNFNSVSSIIKSGYWYLSDSMSMNDLQELQKGDNAIREKTFIASFAYGEGENIAMWAIYSTPWENAVRISIPQRLMREWVENTQEVYEVIGENEIGNPIRNAKIRLIDVCYISGKRGDINSKIYWNDQKLDVIGKPALYDMSSLSRLTGYLKNKAWSYENEVRIKIELPQKLHCTHKVAIKIPQNVISNLPIMTGPWSNTGVTAHFNDINLKITRSVFEGLVKLRR